MADFSNNTASCPPPFRHLSVIRWSNPKRPSQMTQLSFGFARQRWQNGILLSLCRLAPCSGLVHSCFSEIPATPNLKVQMAILGVILIVGGLSMLPKIVVDFFGAVRVDQTGIHMVPSVVGFSAPWSIVEKWEVRDCNGVTASHSIRVWESDTNRSHTVPAGFLSHHDLHRLRRVMVASSPSEKASA